MEELDLRRLLYGDGLARTTVRNYVREIRVADEWLRTQRRTTLDAASAEDIALFVESRPRTYASRSLTRCAIKKYWDVTGRADAPFRALRVPRTPEYGCRALDDDDERRLWKTAVTWDHDRGPEGVATLLGLHQACRRAETARLMWRHVDFDEQLVTVVGKGDKQRTMPLHPVVSEALSVWRRAQPPASTTQPGDVWVFRGRRPDTHVTPTTVWLWIRRVAAVAGLLPVASHRLRHSALAGINDATGDLRTTQAIAGHTKPEVTARYTKTTAARMRAAIMSLDYS